MTTDRQIAVDDVVWAPIPYLDKGKVCSKPRPCIVIGLMDGGKYAVVIYGRDANRSPCVTVTHTAHSTPRDARVMGLTKPTHFYCVRLLLLSTADYRCKCPPRVLAKITELLEPVLSRLLDEAKKFAESGKAIEVTEDLNIGQLT